ncbi:MAG: hypothetical protein ICV73_14060 [Acetobacteraceae bacterium]|nr:hypothetical protein [Acetobacteraceae bacterium]
MEAFSKAKSCDLIRLSLFACLPLLASAPAPAQEPPRFVECALIEGANPPNVSQAMRHEIGFANGRIARVVLTLPNRPAPSVSELLPLREGLSYRSLLFEAPAAPGAWVSVFNLATIEAGGVVLLGTWMRHSTLPNETARYGFMRLRCPSTG